LKSGVTRERLLGALQDNSLEDLFQRHPVQAGDTFFIPARTPHTIGPDMVLCEVQQYSDLTYRVYDYSRVDASGKPRELHVEKALAVMNFDPGAGGKVTPRPRVKGRENVSVNDLVDCPYFSVDRIEFDRTVQFKLFEASPGQRRFQILVVLSGEGVMSYHPPRHMQGPIPLKAGECWFIPADTIWSVRTEGRICLLTAFVR
jgi:mannose-6-phosphate isomerase